MTAEQKKFIESIAKYVRKYASGYGFKVHSAIIAQAILESGWGKSKLAAVYHNYFGMKCGSKWTGPSVNLTTTEEYQKGAKTQIRDNFRTYPNMEEGVRGYFEFLSALSRYDNLKGISDPKDYLKTIKADGYATSSTYAEDVYKCVTSYNLTQYDTREYARDMVVGIMQGWIGKRESNGSHKIIIDIYNSIDPTPRGYKVKYSDKWCAATVSAAYHQAGYDAIFPAECSCFYMIEKAKKMGIWQESDKYVPAPGDCIFYDWEDKGIGDNQGNPDHVGMVEGITGGVITVIEGNYSNSVKRRELAIDGRYIRGYVTPKFTPTEASDFKKRSGRITTDLYVRKGPGTEYSTVGTCQEGAVITILDTVINSKGNSWHKIQYGSKTGYCSGKHVKNL